MMPLRPSSLQHLFRQRIWCPESISRPITASIRPSFPVGPSVTTLRRHQSSFVRRHGKAVEPIPVAPQEGDKDVEETAGPEALGASVSVGEHDSSLDGAEDAAQREDPVLESAQPNASIAPAIAAVSAVASMPSPGDERPSIASNASPLERVLHMEPPADIFTTPSQSSPASLSDPSPFPPVILNTNPITPPPNETIPKAYTHYFDTYSLVKHLHQEGHFTEAQAITAMKAIRSLLAHNLDDAQARLIDRASVENESYLFRAACSEFAIEVRNSRRVRDETSRQQRTMLQHEVDILTQRLGQELVALNDTIRGMFNDRKMAVREEQKTSESAIQQINYKISILLSSDAKTEIEGVRWVLIRRAVMGILFMALLALATVRYATYARRQRALREETERRDAEERKRRGAGPPSAGDVGTGADEVEILAAG